jgi:hypothetical protein
MFGTSVRCAAEQALWGLHTRPPARLASADLALDKVDGLAGVVEAVEQLLCCVALLQVHRGAPALKGAAAGEAAAAGGGA